MILDFDLDFLKEGTSLVDRRLDQLELKAMVNPDPGMYGVYDQVEYITGIGFVACQTYATEVMRSSKSKVRKRDAFALGPKHRTSLTMIEIINAAANYWKHIPEWDFDKLTSQQQETRDTIERLDMKIPSSYPVENMLHRILTPHPARFANLMPFLSQWRDAVQK